MWQIKRFINTQIRLSLGKKTYVQSKSHSYPFVSNRASWKINCEPQAWGRQVPCAPAAPGQEEQVQGVILLVWTQRVSSSLQGRRQHRGLCSQPGDFSGGRPSGWSTGCMNSCYFPVMLRGISGNVSLRGAIQFHKSAHENMCCYKFHGEGDYY